MATKKIVIEMDVNDAGAVAAIKNVGTEVDKVKDKTKDLKKESSGAFKFLETISPRAAGALKGVQGGVQGLIGGFKGLKIALISTGIGALIVALGSLIAYFTQTKRGGEVLERFMSRLGAAVAVITDRFSAMGESIFNAFKNPRQAVSDLWEAIKQNFINRITGIIENAKALGRVLNGVFNLDWNEIKAGAEDFGRSLIQISTGFDRAQQDGIINGFKELGAEIARTADQADRLTAANQRLRDNQRALNVETARARADIKELNKIAEDTTRSLEERIAAAQQAGEIEENLMKRRLALAAENVRIIRQQNALSESLDDDLDRLAQAEIELANIRMESSELQTTIQNKYNTLVREGEAKIIEEKKKTAEEEQRILLEMEEVRAALVAEGIDKELQEVDKKYEELFAKANNNHELEKELIERQEAEMAAIQEKYRLQEVEAEKAAAQKEYDNWKALQDSKLSLAATTIDAISSLATLAAAADEERARKAFAISKALSMAQALASTYAAVNAVLKDPTLVGPSRFIAAASAGVTGLANVAKIAATKFGGGGASGGMSSGGAASTMASAPQATAIPSLGVNLTGQNQAAPIPAYVIGQQVQNDMEARTRVNDLAKL